MLSPALYRFCRSDASLVRSAPVTLVPFLRVSVTLPPGELSAAALPAMITQEVVIGYPHGIKRSGHLQPSPRSGGVGSGGVSSGQGHQVGELSIPQVLDTVRQQQHPLRTEGLYRPLVVSDQDDRPAVPAKRGQDLSPAGRVQVVG